MSDWEDRLKKAATGGAAGFSQGGVPGAVVGALLGGLFGGGGGGAKAQNAALSRQMDLATQALNMQKRQFEQDMPFRTDLFSALRGRQQQQFPRFMPKQPTYGTPLSRRKMATQLPQSDPGGQAPNPSRGGFNVRPGLTDMLRQQQVPPQQLQQLLMRLLQGQGRP